MLCKHSVRNGFSVVLNIMYIFWPKFSKQKIFLLITWKLVTLFSQTECWFDFYLFFSKSFLVEKWKYLSVFLEFHVFVSYLSNVIISCRRRHWKCFFKSLMLSIFLMTHNCQWLTLDMSLVFETLSLICTSLLPPFPPFPFSLYHWVNTSLSEIAFEPQF